MGWWPGGHRASISYGRGGGRQGAPIDDGFGTGTYPSAATIVTPDDTVTNFAQSASILSIRSGAWSSTSTWDLGRVPQAGDIVGIKDTHTVTYDVSSTAAVLAVGVAGVLTFRTDISTKLTVQNLLVYGPPTLGTGNYGELRIGTAVSPVATSVTAEIVFSDVALIDANTGPTTNAEYSNGLLVWGRLRIRGTTKTDFVECTANLTVGQTTLTFQSPVTGWAVGDRIAIPDSRQWFAGITFDNIEVRTIATIAGDGLSCTVAALTYAHPRAVDKDGTQDFAVEVVNLGRNVIFRSANVNGTHGHTIHFNRCDVDVRYARYDSLGRTKNATAPNQTTNQKGRYPFHCHHALGPGDGSEGAGGLGYDVSVDALEHKPGDLANIRSADGPVLRFIGNVIEDQTTSSPDSKWPITLHETSDALIQSNVIYKGDGSLCMFEDGTEVYNVIRRNFLLHCRTGTGDRGDASYTDGFPGREGNGFSVPNSGQYWRDNRVYNIGQGLGFPSNATAYHFYGGQNTHGSTSGGSQENNFTYVKIPAWQGADPDTNFEQRYNYPTVEFSDNECASCETGLTYWFLGTNYTARGPEEIATTTILRYSAWNVRVATFNYPTANMLYSGGKWRGDFAGGAIMGYSTTDYLQRNLILDGVDIQGFNYGVFCPQKVGVQTGGDPYDSEGTTIFRNLILANARNVQVQTMAAVSGGSDIQDRVNEVRNCTFYHPAFWTHDLFREYYSDPLNPGNINWVAGDRLYFYDINGVGADDIRSYWTQQAGSFITPQTDVAHGDVGSPVSGQTNTFNLANHGVCIAGTIWAGTTTRTGFDGYVEAI
jgi:G8 domain-containing protein